LVTNLQKSTSSLLPHTKSPCQNLTVAVLPRSQYIHQEDSAKQVTIKQHFRHNFIIRQGLNSRIVKIRTKHRWNM